MQYPVELTPDEGTFLVTFPDVPEAITYGETEDEALAHAVDALETALMFYIGDRRDLPAPSDAAGRHMVGTTLLGSFKVAIYQEMRKRGWRKADLARALGVSPVQIDRLLDLGHASPLSQLEAAFAALGKTARVQVVDLAA